jgi:hypothetical protein
VILASYLVSSVILPPVACIETEGHAIDDEPCPTCDRPRSEPGYFREFLDSGMWTVVPAHEDDPRAKRCEHDGSRDAWRI